jgi:hypothetical protein
MQGRLTAAAIMAGPRGLALRSLAVDRDLPHRVRQTLGDEAEETREEQRRLDPVHHDPQPIGAGMP